MALQAPKGTTDLLPKQARIWDHFKRCASAVFSRYGYEPIETPIFEQTELFVRGIGEATDVVSKEMFATITGENLKTLLGGGHVKSNSRFSLRPEGTASVVRAVAQHNLVSPGGLPAKLMYAGPMFRAENVQKGRQRQFNQVGIECLGSEDPSIDAEAIIMLMRFYEAIGLDTSKLTLLINSMGCETCRPAYRDAVAQFLIDHEADLCEECRTRAHTNPLRAFDCKQEACVQVMKDAPLITDALCEECKTHYAQVKAYLDDAGISYVDDPTLVRGLDYYTRTVFERGHGRSECHRWWRALRQAHGRDRWSADAGLRFRARLRTLHLGPRGTRVHLPRIPYDRVLRRLRRCVGKTAGFHALAALA